MWSKGNLLIKKETIHYQVKHYDETSSFGINEGKISKLSLSQGGKIIANYDRGWDIKPTRESAKIAFEMLLKEYN
jgi:hypothetical protein